MHPKEKGAKKSIDDFIVFGAPAIGEDEIREVVSSLRSGWLGTGPRTQQFERKFAEYKGVTPANVLAVNSCTAALHLSLIVADVQPGDEVITTAMTFCATVNAIIHTGARPVLCDIDPETKNIDAKALEKLITKKTKAIVPVHFAGLMCDMGMIMALARKYDLLVIEDCAHAIESTCPQGEAGTLGDFGCFSFYVTKNLVTGEGGMIICSDQEKNDRAKRLALHGMSADAWNRFSDDGYKHYQVVECGYKYNMMDLQAAIGIHQLAKIETNWARRQAIWEYYQAELAGCNVQLPAKPPVGYRHAYHLFPIMIGQVRIDRDKLLGLLHDHLIGTGVHYLSIPEHPFYQSTYGWNIDDYPNAKQFGRQTLSIPLGPSLSDDEVGYIADTLKRFLN